MDRRKFFAAAVAAVSAGVVGGPTAQAAPLVGVSPSQLLGTLMPGHYFWANNVKYRLISCVWTWTRVRSDGSRGELHLRHDRCEAVGEDGVTWTFNERHAINDPRTSPRMLTGD
jgi:hypothetical protein